MPWALLFAVLGVLSRLSIITIQAIRGTGGVTSSCWRGTIVHVCLVQLLAVSVTAATDVWTRQAFVAGGDLRQREGQEGQVQQDPGNNVRAMEERRRKKEKGQ